MRLLVNYLEYSKSLFNNFILLGVVQPSAVTKCFTNYVIIYHNNIIIII